MLTEQRPAAGLVKVKGGGLTSLKPRLCFVCPCHAAWSMCHIITPHDAVRALPPSNALSLSYICPNPPSTLIHTNAATARFWVALCALCSCCSAHLAAARAFHRCCRSTHSGAGRALRPLHLPGLLQLQRRIRQGRLRL